MKTTHLFLALTLGLGLALALLVLLGVVTPAHADATPVHYVALTGNDAGDCSATPCRTVQYAVDQAGDGDTVEVATGVYTGVQTRAGITQVVYISKTVAVRGGYRADFGAWDPDAYSTTLDAEARGRVIYAAGPSITLTLEGLRITGGDATGLGGDQTFYYHDDVGGGLYVLDAATVISGNTFLGNRANTALQGSFAHFGGGMYQYGGSATLSGNTFQDNVASGSRSGGGGAMYLGDGTYTLSGNAILSNTGSTVDSGWGGGVYLFQSTAILNSNTFQGNVASVADFGSGGGLYAYHSTITLDGNTLRGNIASTNDGGRGGGVHLEHGTATLTGNTIQDNVATTKYNELGYGGGVSLHDYTFFIGLNLTGNTILSNTASSYGGYGGGVYLYGTPVYVSGNLIQGNVSGGNAIGLDSGLGGGVYVESRQATLVGNTIRGNTAGTHMNSKGGGLYLDTWNYGQPARLDRNFIRDNTASSGGGACISKDQHSRETIWRNNVMMGNRAVGSGRGSDLYVEGAARGDHLWHTTLTSDGSISSTVDAGSSVYVASGSVAFINTIVYSHAVGVHNAGGVVSMTATLWDSVATRTVDAVVEIGSFTGTAAFDADGYHLTPASDAIDTGVEAGVSDDVDRQYRPLGPAPDVGADEYVAAILYLPLIVRNYGP